MPLVGVGIDTVEVARVARLLDRHGDSFVTRWFTPAEVDWCREKGARSVPAFASVLAGKEAVWKALRPSGPGHVPWRTLEVIPAGEGGRVTVPPDLAREGLGVVVSVRADMELVLAAALAWTEDTPAD
ncbi:MAG: 4'-phosphopantetheinyl transferase superfamily protein [Dermatophilaceae bacterium]